MTIHDQYAQPHGVTFDLVLHQLQTHTFSVLATVGEQGQPHSAGVNYGVSLWSPRSALSVVLKS
jgi:hypothetical protein